MAESIYLMHEVAGAAIKGLETTVAKKRTCVCCSRERGVHGKI